MADQRKKILFLVPSLEGGGAERVFVTLLRHLNREKFELHLGLLEAAGPYLTEVPSDVQVHVLNVSRVRYAIPAIVRLVWQLRPATVISTPVNLNLFVAASKLLWPRGIRLFIRESITLSRFLDEEMRHPAFWKFSYRSLYRRADAIVCLCSVMSRDLIESFGIPSAKMRQIYNPVDSERLRTLVEGSGNPYQTARPNLVAVGRLESQKGFDLLLDAMATVSRICLTAHLTILGEGPLRESLEKQRDRLNLTSSVRLLGFQENPFPYYRWADLFVLVSKYEGLPNTMLEAIALGTPVLAADCVGGVREVAELFPEKSFLCERSSSAVASRILDLCKNGCRTESFVENAPLRFESNFGVHAIVRKYEKLLGPD